MIYFWHLVGFRAQIQARAYPPQRERPAPTPRSGPHSLRVTDPLATLPDSDPSLSYGHGAPGRPVGRPASRRRVAAWQQQTGRPTGRAAAPRTLRPGRRGPARCAAAPRNTSRQWTN
jgi:hypothetical protein